MNKSFNIAVYLGMFVILCDQMSKFLIVHRIMPEQGGIPVNSFFNLVLVRNRGVTFGLLSQYNPQVTFYLLIASSFIILAFLMRWLWRNNSPTIAISLGLIIGGAIGNILDRLLERDHAVIDFLDFYVVFNDKAHHWPAFNLADSAIVMGVSLLFLDTVIRGR